MIAAWPRSSAEIPGAGAGRVDERDDRQAELGRQPHLQECLPIAFRVGTAEIAGRALGQVLALLVADEHHLVLVEVGQSRDDRLVVPHRAVAMKLDELLEDQLDVIPGLGASRMPGDLDDLPGVQLRIDLALQCGQLATQPTDLLGDLGRLAPGPVLGVLGLHLGEPRLHLEDRRFEGQPRFAGTGHRGVVLDHWDAADGRHETGNGLDSRSLA